MNPFWKSLSHKGLTISLAVVLFIGWHWLLSYLPDGVAGVLVSALPLAIGIGWLLETQPVRRFRRKGRLTFRSGDTAPLLKALYAKWESSGILAADPATSGEIVRFEREYGVVLPRDVRRYFMAVNGTKRREFGRDDENHVGFWHLDQVRTFDEARITGGDGHDRIFAFAECSLRFAVYG